jgi:uncharacterized protein YutD
MNSMEPYLKETCKYGSAIFICVAYSMRIDSELGTILVAKLVATWPISKCA